MTYDVRNPCPVCGQTCICNAVKPEIGFYSFGSCLDNFISNGNMDINKQKKTLHRSAYTQTDHIPSQNRMKI